MRCEQARLLLRRKDAQQQQHKSDNHTSDFDSDLVQDAMHNGAQVSSPRGSGGRGGRAKRGGGGGAPAAAGDEAQEGRGAGEVEAQAATVVDNLGLLTCNAFVCWQEVLDDLATAR